MVMHNTVTSLMLTIVARSIGVVVIAITTITVVTIATVTPVTAIVIPPWNEQFYMYQK